MLRRTHEARITILWYDRAPVVVCAALPEGPVSRPLRVVHFCFVNAGANAGMRPAICRADGQLQAKHGVIPPRRSKKRQSENDHDHGHGSVAKRFFPVFRAPGPDQPRSHRAVDSALVPRRPHGVCSSPGCADAAVRRAVAGHARAIRHAAGFRRWHGAGRRCLRAARVQPARGRGGNWSRGSSHPARHRAAPSHCPRRVPRRWTG
jgi:hypothetical protein